MSKNSKPNKEWEKELKKIIEDIVSTFMGGGNLPDIIELRMPKIRQLLSAQRERFLEILGGLQMEKFKPIDRARNVYYEDRIRTYNKAVSEINSKIEEAVKKVNP